MQELTRRKFLQDLAILAGVFLPVINSCTPFLTQITFAERLLNDRPTNQLQTIFQSLIATFIPMQESLFSKVPLKYFDDLVVSQFDIYQDDNLKFYRKMLVVFNDLNLFDTYPDAFIENQNEISKVTDSMLAEDRANFKKWQQSVVNPEAFIQLPDLARQSYLLLWCQSPLQYKRAFYRASKLLIYASVFSHERFYSAIGYAGPMLKSRS